MRFLLGLKRKKFRVAADMTVSALLAQHRQSHALNTNLWHPLCLAALNTPPHLAAAQIFVNVLRDAMAVDSLDSCGVYFGTTGGQVYGSSDAGDTWAPIVRDLPAVLSVEVQTLA